MLLPVNAALNCCGRDRDWRQAAVASPRLPRQTRAGPTADCCTKGLISRPSTEGSFIIWAISTVTTHSVPLGQCRALAAAENRPVPAKADSWYRRPGGQ